MLCAIAVFATAATTIDRIAVVVGRHAIKQSDIDRDLRVTQFLNRETPDSSAAAQKKAAQRLIDQELIRSDMAVAGNSGHLDAEAKDLFDQLLKDRFKGSTAQLQMELRRRGLTETELLQQLEWQLVVLRFIDQRFRLGVIVSDEDIQKYYEDHRADLSKSPGENTLEALSPKIRETLEGEQVNKNFEEWLAEARKSTLIQYKVDALK